MPGPHLQLPVSSLPYSVSPLQLDRTTIKLIYRAQYKMFSNSSSELQPWKTRLWPYTHVYSHQLRLKVYNGFAPFLVGGGE